MIRPSRSQPLWYAYLLHRLSGLALALFLPLHFMVLGSVLESSARLDSLLAWSEMPLLKLSEVILVFCLAVHFFGGLRLLALEFLPWNSRQKTFAALAASGAFFVACGFLLRAL